jgi:predicted RND superfamily exporter protein
MRFTDRLIAWRWPLLVLAALATVIAWRPAHELSFDRSIENMFAPDDPLLEPFRQLKRTFGGDEIALAAYVDDELLSPAGLDRLGKLTSELGKIRGVADAFSLANVRSLLAVPSTRDKLLDLSEAYTVGADHETAGIVCVLTPEREADIPRWQTVDELRRVVEAHDATGVVTGEPVMVVDGFRYLEQDGRLLGFASTGLLMLTIVICFRSLRWVLVPICVVGASVLWTEAALAASRLHLSLVSSMLWAIITVIGIATVVHLVIGFREERLAGLPPREALASAGASLAVPIFWSCATDTVSFGSLMVSSVGPVRDFGLMMLVASAGTLLAIVVVVPGAALCGRFTSDPRRAWGEGHLDLGLRRISNLVERYPWWLGGFSAVFSLGMCLGIVNLDVETDFTRNFRRSSPIVRSYEFVESKLGGAGVWDVFVPAPEKPDAEFLEKLSGLERRLREEVVVEEAGRRQPGLTKLLSAVDALDFAPAGRMLAAANLERALELVARGLPIVKSLYGRDPESSNRLYLRIMLRARERQPAKQKHHIIDQVRRIAREEFPEARVTGFFVLLTKLIESTSRDQWTTFGIATCGIFLMVLVVFRSFRLALVALVPNALPIMMVTGLMGWLNVFINMGAAMMASVSMGLAVDSSIHYITDFRRHRAKGLSIDDALHASHQHVGRATVFSTLALIVGFTALALSRFVPTIYFGVLVSLTMLGGLLGNLVILPLLLKLVERE